MAQPLFEGSMPHDFLIIPYGLMAACIATSRAIGSSGVGLKGKPKRQQEKRETKSNQREPKGNHQDTQGKPKGYKHLKFKSLWVQAEPPTHQLMRSHWKRPRGRLPWMHKTHACPRTSRNPFFKKPLGALTFPLDLAPVAQGLKPAKYQCVEGCKVLHFCGRRSKVCPEFRRILSTARASEFAA